MKYSQHIARIERAELLPRYKISLPKTFDPTRNRFEQLAEQKLATAKKVGLVTQNATVQAAKGKPQGALKRGKSGPAKLVSSVMDRLGNGAKKAAAVSAQVSHTDLKKRAARFQDGSLKSKEEEEKKRKRAGKGAHM